MQAVPGQQLLEPAQVAAELRRRNSGVLPAGMGRLGQGHPGIPGGISAQPPPSSRLPGISRHHSAQCRVQAGQFPGVRGHLVRIVRRPTRRTASHVPAGVRVRAQPRRAARVRTVPGVQPLAGPRSIPQYLGHGVGGLGQRGEAEHDQRGVGRLRGKPDGGSAHHGEGAFGADQEARHVEAALGQQVFQRVAGHLPAEATELGADHAQVGQHQLVQGAQRRRRWRRSAPGSSSNRSPSPVITSSPATTSLVRP